MRTADDRFDGLLLADRYQLGPLLGRGGQGSTHLARDLETGTEVAVKSFDLAKAASWKDLELFRREGEALRGLDHPGIPGHLGEIETDGGAQAYLVMEYVPGLSLKDRLRQQGPFEEAALREILEQGLEILAYLESRPTPVVHRDLKPSNFIQRPDGSLALVDFGGVKLRARPDGGSTVVGTLGYMAPEQLYGESTPATDLYGLAATLFALGTGREPEDLPRQGLRIDVDAALPGLSADLRQLLQRMTEPDPAHRPQSAAALLVDLRHTARPGEATEAELLTGPDARQMPAWQPWRYGRRPSLIAPIFLVAGVMWLSGWLGWSTLVSILLPLIILSSIFRWRLLRSRWARGQSRWIPSQGRRGQTAWAPRQTIPRQAIPRQAIPRQTIPRQTIQRQTIQRHR